jgi:hypothetical protein
MLKSEQAAEDSTIERCRIDNNAHIRYRGVFQSIGKAELVNGNPNNPEEAEVEKIPDRYLYISEKKE